MRWTAWMVLALLGCDSGGDGGAQQAGDGGLEADAEAFTCDETLRRAVLNAPPANFACGGAPETITVGGSVEMFKYEASHPLASDRSAFPCADRGEVDFQAPDVPSEACSAAGVRPWHSVKWDTADSACRAIGWRLCSTAELQRACGGDDNLTYAYGAAFEGGKCNVREAYRAEGATTASEAPTGEFAECESPSGGFDLNGNLWEWSADRLEEDARARTYQGAGWRTIAQRHTDIDQACNTQVQLRGFSAPSFANEYVGFRCCRSL